MDVAGVGWTAVVEGVAAGRVLGDIATYIGCGTLHAKRRSGCPRDALLRGRAECFDALLAGRLDACPRGLAVCVHASHARGHGGRRRSREAIAYADEDHP